MTWSKTLAISAALIVAGIGVLTLTYFVVNNDQEQVLSSYNTAKTVEIAPLDADKIFDLVNQERVKAGIAPLVQDERLVASAQYKADDMLNRDYFSHQDPSDPNRMNGVQRAYDNTRVNGWSICSEASENISYGYIDDEGVVKGWMGSKSHREAILNPDYTLTGVAISGTKVVQHFCITR